MAHIRFVDRERETASHGNTDLGTMKLGGKEYLDPHHRQGAGGRRRIDPKRRQVTRKWGVGVRVYIPGPRK